ncbi:hypothetical protein CGLO_12241 [Colletotrichum gloeosporioides Cg-14]|jgi:phosphatidylserine/phosphatidylglycerophosphate/cardiolipin synthase-like enzyme
MTTL